MNQHFQETGETLSAKDIAETIEEKMYESYVASLEKLKEIKKVSKFFQPQQEKPVQEKEVSPVSVSVKQDDPFKEPTLANKTARPLDSRFPIKNEISDEELLAEAEREEERLTNAVAPRKSTNSKVPFAFLSREERLARLHSE